MNVYLNSLCNHSIFLFKETALPVLTEQQKKVLMIASVIFGLLATCYIVRRCCFMASIQKEEDKSHTPHPIKHKEEVKEDVKKELLNSESTLTLEDGTIYKGELKDNKLQGKGKIIFPNGDIFEGEFQNNALNGLGKKTFADGDVYEGEFRNNELNGPGKMLIDHKMFSDHKHSFVGMFKGDKLNGKGKITLADGDVYEGEFIDNILNGEGKKILGGNLYEGIFKNGKLNGPGKITFAIGGVCEGEFKDDELVHSDDRDVLEEEFKDV